MVQRVLILGGTGFIGCQLVEQLQRRSVPMTVPTRHLAAGRRVLNQPQVHVAEADVTDPQTLASLVAAHDAVVNLVGILHGNEHEFERVHVQLPRQIAQACAQAGGRRLLHVSALGAATDAPSAYLRSKACGEAVLHEAAQAGAVALTILRPSIVFGAGDCFMNTFARLQKIFPFIPLAGVDARMQPVWVQDVARALALCLCEERAVGQTLEAVGPEIWILRDLVRAAGQWSGVRDGQGRAVIGLSKVLGNLQAFFLEIVPGKPLMSRDNLKSLKVDNVASGKLPTLEALGIEAAPLSAVGPLFLGEEEPQIRLNLYRRTAGR